MPTTVPICKFVGTIGLGLLTGVSYTLSTQSLPSLLTLPSATPAAHTLRQTARLADQHTLALSSLSGFTLALAYILSPPRSRHPYLLWTASLAFLSGVPLSLAVSRLGGGKGRMLTAEEAGDANGEEVEGAAREKQWVEGLRAAVSGLGFVMGVVGIWGDGA